MSCSFPTTPCDDDFEDDVDFDNPDALAEYDAPTCPAFMPTDNPDLYR